MTWPEAEAAWCTFLGALEAAQFELGCTWSNAWFRGVEDASYKLLPSLHRREWRDIPPAEKPRIPTGTVDIHFSKVALRRRQLRHEIRRLQDEKGKTAELSKARNAYKNLERKEKELKEEVNQPRQYKPLLRLGERDAFINYQFRSGADGHSSWQVLAEMQHHGVPTRLLDCSDVLISALYFALRQFQIRLEKYWRRTKSATMEIPFPPDDVISGLPSPALWILNPYFLARHSSKRRRIWDLTLDHDLDYYACFIEKKSWLFDAPIPIYSPWKNPRIAAQRGMFLVWGYDRRPLDELLPPGSRILRRLEIGKLAAIYGVKHIRQLSGLDRFGMYRDLDALGAKVRREFLHDPNDREEDFD